MAEQAETTFQYEEDLPSLPLPSLDETLGKYLKSCRALLSDEEYEHTEAVCEDFKNGVGKELHEYLESKAETERNWIEEWWETIIYLRPRYPSAVNINWQGVLPGNWGPRALRPAQAAAITLTSVMQFRKMLLNHTMPVERLAGQPLSMHQYLRMFNSCVVPGEECDSIEVYPDNELRHILVLKNNLVYTLDVLDENGECYPVEILANAFEKIREESSAVFELERNSPVSILTSENRTNWWKAREYLVSLDNRNEENFLKVQKAIFVIALEDSEPPTGEEVAKNCLLGDGRNRWYDKPINMIIYENGKAGINGQHAWADALVVVRLFDWVVKNIGGIFKEKYLNFDWNQPVSFMPNYERLQWTLDNVAISAIESASAAISRLIHASQLKHLSFNHYGKGFLKRYKLVPDFYVQMAIQLAYYRMYGHATAVYETGHTRLFYHGRTATVRACSVESLEFVKAMVSKTATDTERWDKLNAAIANHKKLLKDAMLGRDVDRHLFGLQVMAEMSGQKPRPSLFTDKAFTTSRKFLMSTSNISGGGDASPLWGGFSAMYDEGYGCCYGINEDKINFCITCYRTCPTSDGEKFARHLETALLDMRDVVVARNVMYLGQKKGNL